MSRHPALRFFCLLGLALLCGAGLRADETRGGIAFVKGLSGSLTADGRGLSKHESFDPVGQTIVSGPSGRSCLVFSNRMALVLEPDTTLKVVKFRQALPDGSAATTDNVEMARSEIELKLERGGFALAQVQPRATSSLTIELPSGTLSGRVSAMIVTLDSAPPQVAMLDGTLRLSRSSGRPLVLQSGQWLDLGKTSNLSTSGMLHTLDTTERKAVSDQIATAQTNYRLVVFSPDGDEGWETQVRIPKASARSAAKNDFMIHN